MELKCICKNSKKQFTTSYNCQAYKRVKIDGLWFVPQEDVIKLIEELHALTTARDKSAKVICEDCGAALARF